jgi:putative spermidine/putrescine transport system substrate-binding protein
LCVVAFSAAAVIWGQPSAASDQLIVTTYGGVWADAVEASFAKCYEERTGSKPNISIGSSAEWLAQARASAGKPPLHVLMLGELDAIHATREGLLEQISADKVPNLEKIPAKFREPWNDHAVAMDYGGLALLYNKEAISEPPSTWEEFFKGIADGRYGRNVSLMSMSYAWGPSLFWFIQHTLGLDEDGAFEYLAQAHPNIYRFWSTSVESLNLFANREVDVITVWDGRAYNFVEENDWAAVVVPGPHTLAGSTVVAVTKGAPEAAWIYVDCVLDAEAQAIFSGIAFYGMTNKEVVYPASISDKVTASRDVVVPPLVEISAKIPQWIERWNREMR